MHTMTEWLAIFSYLLQVTWEKTKGSFTTCYLHAYCIFYKSLHLRTLFSYQVQKAR
jgi:hypothetical protein